MSSGHSLEAVTRDLYARTGEADIEPTLDRMAAILDLLGSPQRSAPVIHVTGTNGKTSTARMIESLLRAIGLRTGLYTSPHLHSVTERISIDGQPLPPQDFVGVYQEIEPLLRIVDARAEELGERRATFFEAVTALAFAAFADAPVDVMILEVGLGGAWDATNLADGAVAVVTEVAVDHTEYLGSLLEQIAAEKAGIIKPGALAVLGRQSEAAARVLVARCAEAGAGLAREGIEFGVVTRAVAIGGQMVTLQGRHCRYDDVYLPLFGAHQASNAAMALAAVESLVAHGQPLADEAVRDALGSVTSPGRLEVLQNRPSVIVDAAHNPAGGQALAAALADSFAFDATVGVVAFLAGKDVTGIISALEGTFDHVIVTANSSPRALPAAAAAQIAAEVIGRDRVWMEPDLPGALAAAFAWADDRAGGGAVGIVVTGSVVTVGDARTLLMAQR